MEDVQATAQVAWLWIKVIGAMLLIGLIPALVISSMFIKPPNGGEPTPLPTDPL